MAESERMAALKRAYADIILNTAKEAAGRVMESERKAHRFQQDLASAKDEALRLLLRLKQMIDAKVFETTITTSHQKSRIDVLESQLQEAEGVIMDLREELKWASDKLEKVKNNQGHPLNGRFGKENEFSHGSRILDNCSKDENMAIHEGKRQRKMQRIDANSASFISKPHQLSSIFRPSFLPTRCKTYSFSLYGDVKSGEDRSKKTENVKLKLFPRLDPGLTLIKGGIVPISGSENVAVAVEAHNGSGIVLAAKKDAEMVNRDNDATMNSTVPCEESNSEMANVPIVYSDLSFIQASKETKFDVPLESAEETEVCEEPITVSPIQADNQMLIKYTFHRRRKDSLRSPGENTSSRTNTVDKIADEERHGSTEPQKKASLLNESSREKRRLVQVARQLISLSAKKW